jgi:hypothetical protein
MTLGWTRIAVKDLLLIAAVGTAVAACGSPSQPSTATTTQAPASETTSGTAPATSTATASPQTVIDITIAGGEVTPTNAQAQAVAGEPIVLEVSSDVVDELHVHSVPEQKFDVEARPDQQFEFTVAVPGRVDVELHDLHRTVVTFDVVP